MDHEAVLKSLTILIAMHCNYRKPLLKTQWDHLATAWWIWL